MQTRSLHLLVVGPLGSGKTTLVNAITAASLQVGNRTAGVTQDFITVKTKSVTVIDSPGFGCGHMTFNDYFKKLSKILQQTQLDLIIATYDSRIVRVDQLQMSMLQMLSLVFESFSERIVLCATFADKSQFQKYQLIKYLREQVKACIDTKLKFSIPSLLLTQKNDFSMLKNYIENFAPAALHKATLKKGLFLDPQFLDFMDQVKKKFDLQ